MLYNVCMDELNNKQMILLTMFTSFVVTLATVIVTTAMLEEAPQTLTQTVNRVVERTIERVVTGTSTLEKQTPVTVTNVTKEVTVYAKEEDLLVAAVEKNQPRMAQVFFNASSTVPAAIGFVVSRDGLIACETKSLLGENAPKDNYVVTIRGKNYQAIPMNNQDIKDPVFFLKVMSAAEGETFDAVSFGRGGTEKLAQTVVVLGGEDGDAVFKTTLSKLRYTKQDATSTPSLLTGIETIPMIPEDSLGGLVVNLDGQAVGIVIRVSDAAKYVIYPVARLLELVGGASSAATTEKPVGAGAKNDNAAAVGAL